MLQVELSKQEIQKIRQRIEKSDSVFSEKRYLESLGSPNSIIGRQNEAEELVKLLHPSRDGFSLPFVSVFGKSGTGKSTVIDELLHLNYACMPEISREITLEAQKNGVDQLFLKNPHLFSQLLLEGREKQYKEAHITKSTIIFFDRGIPDVHAYMNYLGVE